LRFYSVVDEAQKLTEIGPMTFLPQTQWNLQ